MTFQFYWFTWADNVSRETRKMKDLKHILTASDHLVTGKKFDVLKNLHTGILETHPRPNKEELPLYYESKNYASHSANNKPNGFLSFCYKQVKIALQNKLNLIISLKKDASNALDIGAGTGDFLKYIKSKNRTVFGIEPNKKARELAFKKGINLEESIANLKGKTFDVITLWHVLEHLPNLEITIQKIEELLSTNGVLIIAVPNFNSFDAAFYKNYWAAFDVPTTFVAFF